MTELQSKVELPKGWAYFTLANLASAEKNAIKRGPFGSTIKKEYFEPSGYKVYQQQNAIYNDFSTGKYYIGEKKFQELKDFELKPGDLLISCSGTIGKIALVPENAQRGIINQALLKITLDPRIVFAKYFSYFFGSESFQKKVLKNTRGTAIKNITSVKDLKQIPLPIPPINEQYRIISKVEELFSFLDAGAESLRKVKAQLKRYRQAVLKCAFEGKLTEQWRKTHRELEYSETLLGALNLNELSGLPALPESWKWLRVENIGEVSGGLAKNSHRGECSHKMPYLRVANVYAGHLLLDEIKYIGVNENEVDKLLLKEGDLLIVEGNGSIDQIGRVAVWGGQISPCIHQNHIIKIRFADPTDSLYALYWLLSPDGREHIKKVASSTSGLHTLSISKIKKLPIPFSTKIERKKIVSEIEQKLSVLENVEQHLPSLIALTNRLRQSILKQAFEGQLVPQNPSDESAEMLLERIKAGHFNNKKPKIDNQLELSHYVK